MTCFKKFVFLIKYDLKNGILYRMQNYLGICGFAAIIYFDYYIRCIKLIGIENIREQPLTYADYLLYCFSGCYPHIEKGQTFLVPITWIVIFLYPVLLNLNYPLRDLSGNGIQVLIRTGGRIKWYLAKILFLFESTICYFIVFHFSIAGLCLVTGQKYSWTYSEEIMEKFLNYTFKIKPEKTELLLFLWLLPFVVSLTVNIFQFTLSIMFKQIYSYIIILTMLVASAYFYVLFLPGTYGMMIRSFLVIQDGINWIDGIMVCTIWMLGIVTVGIFKMRRCNIL